MLSKCPPATVTAALENHFDLPAVVGVDDPSHDVHPAPGHGGARLEEAHVPVRNRHGKPGADDLAVAHGDGERRSRGHVVAAAPRRLAHGGVDAGVELAIGQHSVFCLLKK